MPEAYLAIICLLQLGTAVWIRRSMPVCQAASGLTCPIESPAAKSVTIVGSTDFDSAEIHVHVPGPAELFRPRTLSFEVTCQCGRTRKFSRPDPWPVESDHLLHCLHCGRFWRDLGDVLRERSEAFCEYVRCFAERN